MSAPSEEIFDNFQPDAAGFSIDGAAEGATLEALAIRRAIDELPLHANTIPPAIVAGARDTAEKAVEASFIAHIPMGPIAKTSQHARTIAERPSDDLEATGGYPAPVGPNDQTVWMLPEKTYKEMRLGNDSPEEAKWKPTPRQVVEQAHEPVEFDEVAATVARVALEKVAEQNIASIENPVKVDEVVRAREVLRDLFHEEVPILPPARPPQPEVFAPVHTPVLRRQSFGRLAVVPMMLLSQLRRHR